MLRACVSGVFFPCQPPRARLGSLSAATQIEEKIVDEIPLSKRLALHALWVTTDGREGTRIDFSRESIPGLNTLDAVLTGAKLNDSDLRKVEMSDDNLVGADLGGSDLRGADLKGADFTDARLKGIRLRGANLNRANLQNAELAFADLRDATLSKSTSTRRTCWAPILRAWT